MDQGRDRRVEVAIIEGFRLLAEQLAAAIDAQHSLRSVATTASVDGLLELLDTGVCPDVVVIDLESPGVDGMDGVRLVKERLSSTSVLVLTASPTRQFLSAAADTGVDGILSKEVDVAQLVAAVRQASTDACMLVDRRALPGLVNGDRPGTDWADGEAAGNGSSAAATNGLTAREMDILHLLARGDDPKRIARRLGLSIHTVRSHIRRILQKLGVHSQLQAVLVATRHGLLADQAAG